MAKIKTLKEALPLLNFSKIIDSDYLDLENVATVRQDMAPQKGVDEDKKKQLKPEIKAKIIAAVNEIGKDLANIRE